MPISRHETTVKRAPKWFYFFLVFISIHHNGSKKNQRNIVIGLYTIVTIYKAIT